MTEPLVIIGAGGFGREVAMAAEACDPAWSVWGFFDDRVDENVTIEGWERLGVLNDAKPDNPCVIAVGNPRLRRALCARLSARGSRFVTIDVEGLRHPSVSISHGGMLVAGVRTTVNTSIGKHFIANLNCTIGHDVVIGDFVTIAPLVAISGNVRIGDGVEIGTAACIREGVTIGKGAMIGMGAVVVKDVAPNSVVVGNPARHVKELEPW